jgi:hypothetical protein
MFTEALPLLAKNPIDCAVLVDAWAHAWATMQTFEVLGGRLAIINTAGDALALPSNQVPLPVGLVANHDEAKKLQALLPGVRLFWVDAEGSMVWGSSTEPVDVFISQHLATMRSSNPEIVAKEFDGHRYTPTAEMTAWDLFSDLIDVQPGETQPK